MLKTNTPTNLVLFGITGDLAHKKIIPGLYHLYESDLLPRMFNVIGFSRRDLSKSDLDTLVTKILEDHKDINPSSEQLKAFLCLFKYQQGDFTDQSGYKALGEMLGNIDGEWVTCSNKLFYLSVPPSYYEDIFRNLAESKLAEGCSDDEGWTRVIVEKPFGKDLKTAESLDMLLGELFEETQIYRIDHFVAKEMVQNVMAFRFANSFLENSWNNETIESIEIYFPETLGVENRGSFYDGVGALRDIGQNHLLQLLAAVTMEDPKKFTDTNIRNSRASLLSKLVPLDEEQIKQNTYRAQYNGYTEINGVSNGSTTETYFKVKAFIDSKRWQGVPIILESGKRMRETDLKIYVNYKEKNGCKNRVVFDLQGDGMGIYVEFYAKKPGLTMALEKRVLSFSLLADCDACNVVEPYERLILDCMNGDQTLFISTDEVMSMWKFIDPIICAWDSGVVPLDTYEPEDENVRFRAGF